MPLRLYNTRTRATEPFLPIDAERVRVYVCGLTPSAEAHLGHARSFLFFDVLRRYLTVLGLRVTFVQNVTDIDDRSIVAARERGVEWKDVVAGYYASFKASMRRLHVTEPDHEPRATEFIPQIIAMIGALVERGYAYAAADGVYFRVRSFPRYGALSGRNLDELLVGARIEPGEGKDDPLDFALWKFAKAGEPEWPSPWGAGRPGWHIECSAMAHALLGEPFDIHGGGYDLIFPHHENEIAQSESLMAKPPMARFWLHGGLLQFDGRKMSKSLGNFEPLAQLLDRHEPQAIRLLFLQTGYRKPMNFTEDAIASATTGLARLLDAYDALRDRPPSVEPATDPLAAYAPRFWAALDDDMNTSGAVSVLFEIVNARATIAREGGAGPAAAFLHQAMEVLGISPRERGEATVKPAAGLRDDIAALWHAKFPDIVAPTLTPGASAQALVEARNVARKARDFALADRIRAELTAENIAIADAPNGESTWSIEG
ncbi:MAG: cysteine--tRNA ligase [Candidatus Baltobacteraceae bacterium]